MNTIDKIEEFFITKTNKEIIDFLKNNGYIKLEYLCKLCNKFCNMIKYKRSPDGYAWRCNNSKCDEYLKYISIRTDSFFNGFTISFAYIFRVLTKYVSRTPQHAIINSLDISSNVIKKILKKLKMRIPAPNFSNNKLGSGNKIVQVDETMLNYKCKSHRGRSPTNKTDSISIVEIGNGIERCFAQVIADKKASTLIPIICNNVCHGATIHTDEHRSYGSLSNIGFTHGTVCHKYNFVNHLENVNTQAVESSHSSLKYWIKERKGVKTELRNDLLNEFCYYYNNRDNYLIKILELIKLNN